MTDEHTKMRFEASELRSAIRAARVAADVRDGEAFEDLHGLLAEVEELRRDDLIRFGWLDVRLSDEKARALRQSVALAETHLSATDPTAVRIAALRRRLVA